MDILSDISSQQSKISNENVWIDFMNLSFNTKIFSMNCEYIYELENIYATKAIIDEVLSEIIPNI